MATLDDLVRELKEVEKNLPNAIGKAITTATRRGLIYAVWRTSGPYSLAELAKRDHPYAKRHGAPIFSLRFINRQSGKLSSSWQQQPTIISTSMVTSQIKNDDPVIQFLKGTRFMFGRPIDETITEDMKPFLRQALKQEIKQLMRKI